MRKILRLLLVVASLSSTGSLWAGLSDIQITVDKQTDKDTKKASTGEGDTGVQVTKVTYNFKIADTGFNDISDLTVDYIIFVERQKLGKKKDEDVVVRITGTQAIATLNKKEPQTVTAKEIELSKASLTGNYYYGNGGRIKVEDNVKGVWIRVTKAGQVVGEYVNPTTLSKLGWQAK